MMKNNLTPGVPGEIAFKPKAVSDANVTAIKEQKARDQAAASRYISSVLSSLKAQERDQERYKDAAKAYGKDVEKLTQFSQSLVNYFKKEQEAKNQRDMEQGIADAYNDGISFEEQSALEQVETEISSADSVTQEASAAAFAKTGNPDVARRVKDLSGWRGYGYQVGKAQMAGAGYDGYMRAAMESDNETIIELNGRQFTPATAKTLPEIQAAVAKLRGNYIRQQGLTGIQPALLNKYAFPRMQFSDYGLIAKRQAESGIEEGFNDRQLAISQFSADKDLAGFVSRLKNSIDTDGKGTLGSAAAWQKVEEQLSDMVQSGKLTISDIEGMKGQAVPASWGLGAGKTFGELFGTRLDSAVTKATQKVRADESQRRTEMGWEAQDAEKELVKKIASGEYNDADIDALQKEFALKYGKPSRALEDAQRAYSVDSETKRAQEKFVKGLAATGALRPHHLQGLHPDVVLSYKQMAEQYEQAAGTNNSGIREDVKALEREVKTHLGLELGEASLGVEGQLILNDLTDFYNKAFAKAAAGGDPQARQNALIATLNYFNSNKGTAEDSRTGAKGTKGKFSQGEIFKQFSGGKEQLVRLQDINDTIGTIGMRALDSPGLILKEADMLKIDKTYGTAEWEIPPLVQHLSNVHGMDPYQIINRQRAALGLDPLPSLAGEIKSQMTPEGQSLLDNFKSQNRSIRSMSQSGMGWNADTHPYGNYIEQSAANHDLEPAHIAAMIEIESGGDPNSVSYNGSSFGLMQINRSAHPQFFMGGDWKDAQHNIDYGAAYFSQLLQQYGDLKAAAMAYNAGPGNYDTWAAGGNIGAAKEREMINHGRKFMKALSRYDKVALNDPMSRRGQFEVVQVVSTDPRYEGDSDPTTLFDPAGHGGDAMHQHYEFATKEQARLAKALYESKGFRVTSYIRPHDHGSAHQHGYAIDVAPPINLPRTDEAEMAWIDKANAVIGLN